MKKIVSEETFSFRINGTNVVDISPKGVLVSDEDANLIKARYGSLVTIEEADVKEEVKKVLEENTKEETSPEKEEVVENEADVKEEVKNNKSKK